MTSMNEIERERPMETCMHQNKKAIITLENNVLTQNIKRD